VTIEIVARQFCHVIILTAALESQHGLPQCFAPLYATGTWDNKALPRREVTASFVCESGKLAPGDKVGALSNSLTDGCQRPRGDRSIMQTWQRGPLLNFAHY
jgi:hypothetical protein